ncbi:MAG: VWA domain-containing protein [Proteobacteria bacterium]|nr:VWA domain-containing protein [Pseudomonadota bacterium]
MIDTQAVMRSLPLVASILGKKYGVKVEIGGSEAFTNGETIHLPALPVDIPDTFLALARGYLDHEAAHVRDTDFDALKQAQLSPIEMHVWNSIEDYRVENKLAAAFPGCRGNFDWLIRHVFGSSQPQSTAPSATDILNWILLHIRCWDVPELCNHRDSLAAQIDSQFPGVRGQIEAILGSVRSNCHSTQDAIDAAREIVRVLEQTAQDRHKAGKQEHSPGNDESGTDGQDGNPGNTPETTTQTSTSAQPETETTPCPITDEGKQELSNLLQADESELPPTLGSILSATLEGASRQGIAENTITVAVEASKPSSPFAYDDIQEATHASVALRTRLHGLLQTKVEARCATGRRGRLDTRSLHRLAVSDPRVFRRNQNRQGIDTAVHVLLDCSGSMVRRIHLACTACYAVGKALESMGINVAITAFPAEQLPDGSYTTVAPIIRHGQRVHTNLDLSAAGGTPMGEALWWTMQDMLSLSENRKIILIITDGSPDNTECAVRAITVAKATGFEVYGIGIGSDCIGSLLPRTSRTIQTLPELSPAMFGVLQSALLS